MGSWLEAGTRWWTREEAVAATAVPGLPTGTRLGA